MGRRSERRHAARGLQHASADDRSPVSQTASHSESSSSRASTLLTADTHLDDLMHALLGAQPGPRQTEQDPATDDVEGRLEAVIASVGLAPRATAGGSRAGTTSDCCSVDDSFETIVPPESDTTVTDTQSWWLFSRRRSARPLSIVSVEPPAHEADHATGGASRGMRRGRLARLLCGLHGHVSTCWRSLAIECSSGARRAGTNPLVGSVQSSARSSNGRVPDARL